jgi:hypothetical protein
MDDSEVVTSGLQSQIKRQLRTLYKNSKNKISSIYNILKPFKY